MEEECIFCRIINKKEPADIIYEDENFMAFKDINPKAELHILILPKKHIESVANMKQEEQNLMGELIFLAKKIAEMFQESRSGYKIVFNVKSGGGQIVPHIHLHLLAGNNIILP